MASPLRLCYPRDEDVPETRSEVARRVVGREAELSVLDEFLAAERWPRALVLTGGPGIGKTTLWDAGIDLARRRCLVRAQTVSLTGAFGTLVSPAVTELTITAPVDGVALAEASCWAHTGASAAQLQFGMRTGDSTTFLYEDMAANEDALVSARRSSTLVAGTDYVFQVRRAHQSGSGAGCTNGTYSLIFVPFKLDGSSH